MPKSDAGDAEGRDIGSDHQPFADTEEVAGRRQGDAPGGQHIRGDNGRGDRDPVGVIEVGLALHVIVDAGHGGPGETEAVGEGLAARDEDIGPVSREFGGHDGVTHRPAGDVHGGDEPVARRQGDRGGEVKERNQLFIRSRGWRSGNRSWSGWAAADLCAPPGPSAAVGPSISNWARRALVVTT